MMQSGPAGNAIRLNPVVNSGQFVKWEMSLNGGKSQGPGDYPVIHVPQGPDSGVITFTIAGSPNNQITFAPTIPPPPQPGSGPIYIQAGDVKPSSGVDSQFSYTVSTDGKVLTLTDKNLQPGHYAYVMNFANADQLEPIINNGGPPLAAGTSNYNYAWYAVGIVALIVIVVLVMRMMQRRA